MKVELSEKQLKKLLEIMDRQDDKEARKLGYWLRRFTNPIIDNRIVNDMTFAERLKSFIEETSVCDAMGEEEKEYLLGVARRLLDWQVHTATDEAEVRYLKRTGYIK